MLTTQVDMYVEKIEADEETISAMLDKLTFFMEMLSCLSWPIHDKN